MSLPSFPAARARRLAARPLARRLAVLALAVLTCVVVASLVRAGDAARRSWGATRPVAVAQRDLAPGDAVSATAVEVRDLPVALVPDGALAEAPAGAVARQPVLAGEALVDARLAPQGLTGTAALVPAGHRAMAVPVGPSGTPPLALGDLVDVVAVVPGAVPDGPLTHDSGGSAEGARPTGDDEPPDGTSPDAADSPDDTDGASPGDTAAPPGDADRPGDAAQPQGDSDGDGASSADDSDPPGDGDRPGVAEPQGDGDGEPDGRAPPPAFTLVERALVVAVGDEAITVAVPQADAPAVAFAASQGGAVLALAGP